MSKSRNQKVAVPTIAAAADNSEMESDDDIKQQTTDQLWRGVKDCHAGVESARATMVSAIRITNDCALEAGRLLIEIQIRTERGKWQKTVEANCSVGIREAQRYMDLYRNREVLDKLDPDWRNTFTMVEALTEIAFDRSEQSAGEVEASRETRAKKDPKVKNNKRLRSKQLPKAKVKTSAQVKAAFDPFRRGITAIERAVDHVNQANTLERIEAGAIAVAKKCEDLVGQCRRRKAAITGGRVDKIDMTINGRPIQPPTLGLPGKKVGTTRRIHTTDQTSVAGGSKA